MSEDRGFNDLVVLVLSVAIVWTTVAWLWEQAANYQGLEAPYKIVGGFYFIVVVTPIRLAGWIYMAVTTPGVTQWPNLNLALGVLSVILYVAIIGAATFGAIQTVNTRVSRIENAGTKTLVVLLTAPAAFALLWFLLSSTVRWLFAPA